MSKQDALWQWFTPHISTIFGQNIKSDTLAIWTSFLEYMFYHKDPRRVQPLFDHIFGSFQSMDFNAELSFDAVKIISLFRTIFEELSRKFVAWTDETVERVWAEINCEHDDVRSYISEIMCFAENMKWNPKPSAPTAEAFVHECTKLPLEVDIMSMRGTYHKSRIAELVENFKVWRTERIPGPRAFQSKYDRVGVMTCKWLYQSIHDIHAISNFDYILPLMPELFRFTEVNDNNNLAVRASSLLVRMCGVTPPVGLINPMLDAIFEAIQTSPSWKVRLKALPLVQVFYFRQVALISEVKIVEMLEVLCRCLDDEIVEVREMAATTLSGILRLSPRRSVMALKDRFVRLLKSSYIPDRQDPSYSKAIRQRHASILGICALVDSYPYTVEKWMPELLTNILAEHTYDPIPISTTVRKCAGNFKRTHQDTWHEDATRFNESQLASLSTLLSGSSYYA
jgi:proteasome activator subunit 4